MKLRKQESKKIAILGSVAVASFFASGISASADTYTVQSGDTLSAIAEKYNTTIENLITINNIQDIDVISVGQTIEITGNTSEISVEENTYITTSKESTDNYSSSIVLANGNTAGSVGAYAASQVAAATGTSASTWEYIIARESGGNINAYNPSGASGLFQTMPGWGSTATVEDQIKAAIRAYQAQGFSAWGI